ncbi:MAG: acyltransferase [Prevotella sp.]|nr:acyltransferase [Prevotella sp.]
MDFRRLRMVFKYGWKDAMMISQETGRSRIGIFMDILSCFLNYYVWSNQYRKEKLYSLQGDKRKEICLKLQNENIKRVQWLNEFYDNYKFLNKWSRLKYEQSANLQKKKWDAYTQRYGFGKNCVIGHDVLLVRHHHLNGTISVGNNVLIAKHTLIDYSGVLIIHDNVSIANGVIIETHTHPLEKNRQTPIPGRLEIGEGVKILSNAYISDTCHVIGRYARIGAGTYVRSNVPRYAIMMGNPAKIIGFLYSPEEMVEFENNNFEENDRTSIEQYENDYKKYFSSRVREIRTFVKK